jgi:hypothetical protein
MMHQSGCYGCHRLLPGFKLMLESRLLNQDFLLPFFLFFPRIMKKEEVSTETKL